MEPRWIWLPDLHRYRDLATGRFVSADQVLTWAQEAMAAAGDVGSAATALLVNGQLAVGEWQTIVRQELKDSYIQQYVLGKGGLEQMAAADWGSIGGMLAEQYRYLDAFAAEIAAGNLSAAQIEARLGMYFESANEAYERANARAYGVPELPDYPGSGNTVCLTRCGCHWEFAETEGGWNCYWRLDPAKENCPDCQERAATWNPLFIPVL
jgi:hypothetical protein